MSYLIHYEESTGKYLAKSLKEPLAVGGGTCLSSAVDDLEQKIQKLQLQKSTVHKVKASTDPLRVVEVSKSESWKRERSRNEVLGNLET